MLFRRLFRRGPSGPHRVTTQLVEALTAAGLRAEPADADAPEHAAGRPPGARSRGLIRIANGPPDFLNVTGVDAGPGDLPTGGATGFHCLMRNDRLSGPWRAARLEAKREFAASDVGAARRFRWTPSDDAPPSRAAAEALHGTGTINDRVMRLLREPGTLALEIAPEEEVGALRLSLFLGSEQSLEPDEIALLRDLCRSIVGQGAASTPEQET